MLKGEKNLISEIISSSRERLSLFRKLPKNKQAFVLLNLPKRIQKEVLDRITDKELVEIIDFLDPDKTTDLLQNITPARRKRVLGNLGKEIREKIEFLLKFDPRTAAGLMSLDYIEVHKGTTFEYLSEMIHKHELRTGRFPVVLIVDNGFLVGELPSYVLAVARRKEKIDKYVKSVPSIRYDKSEKEVIETFRKHPHNKIVVLDKDKSILGIIYSDDILKLIEKQSSANLSSFAGLSEEEDVLDSPLMKVKYRYKWLIINLGTEFLAAGVVAIFQKTIASFVLLAVYMPIVAGMGGNAATQSLAVVVRGFALKEINSRTARRIILNEAIAGVLNGIINGVLVAVVAVFFNKNPMLGLVVALAMLINLLIAGVAGTTIPLIMKSLDKDPASSATIFITTLTDVCGFFSFLGLASIIL